MNWVESLQKAIDYMEQHLLEDISMESIAKQANTSSFHFHRIFSILTGITISEYLRRRRLTLAAEALSKSNCKIIDIAFKYGYETQKHLQKLSGNNTVSHPVKHEITRESSTPITA
jgi:AraC family transcriptional regulator